MLGIKPSTFYRWYDRFRSGGLEALEDKPSKPDRVWNRIPDDIRQRVVMMAFEQPELSPRELATRFTDTNSYYVSESSVYRALSPESETGCVLPSARCAHVSLAAALALPDDFPGRDFVLATTFAVILVTVLIQGATLAPLIRVLGLSNFTQQRLKALSEAAARAQMAAAQLAEVERQSAGAGETPRHPRLIEQYNYRARAAARFSETAGGLIDQRRDHFTVVLLNRSSPT